MSENTFAIKIMNKSFQIKCPPEHLAELQESAQYFDDKIREQQQQIKTGNQNNAVIPILTGLNIAHELLKQKRQNQSYISKMQQKIEELQQRVELVLANEDEVVV